MSERCRSSAVPSCSSIGYLRLTREDASLPFRLLVRRYERASLIVTSNQSFIDWGEIFGDHVLATAILDRLLHHASTLNIKGDSFRLKEKRRAGLLGRAPASVAPTPQESDATNPDLGHVAELDLPPVGGHLCDAQGTF